MLTEIREGIDEEEFGALLILMACLSNGSRGF